MATYARSMPASGGGLYVTTVRQSIPSMDVVSREHGRTYLYGPADVEIVMRGALTPGLSQIIGDLYRTNGSVYVSGQEPRAEWACLYCTTPNKVERAKCEQCGAPRNWCF